MCVGLINYVTFECGVVASRRALPRPVTAVTQPVCDTAVTRRDTCGPARAFSGGVALSRYARAGVGGGRMAQDARACYFELAKCWSLRIGARLTHGRERLAERACRGKEWRAREKNPCWFLILISSCF